MPSHSLLIATLSPIDLGIVAFCLSAMLAVGCYFSRGQGDANEFFLGRRSLGWLPLGLSQATFLASALGFAGVSDAAYNVGLKTWIIPLTFWLVLPVVVFLVIPVYRGLALTSIFEYLEQRFDSRTRQFASLLFVVWRLAWLSGILSIAGRMIGLSAGWTAADWLVIGTLGIAVTLTTALGGMRGLAWTSVWQCGLILTGIIVVATAVWLSLSGGPVHVAEVAGDLGRLTTAQAEFSWSNPWTIWGALPYWLIATLAFCLADQMPSQRDLAAKDINTARTSYFICALSLTILLSGLIYLGLCLLGFYHDHPEALAPEWVVNLDGQSRQPILDDRGFPLLDSRNPAHRLTPENIDQLVADRRILRPNDKLPFTAADELVDPATGRVLVEKLAMFRPGQQREVILRPGAAVEMLPRFISLRLGWGGAGIAVAAMLAAAMAVLGAGVHAVATLIAVDFRSQISGRAVTISVGIAVTVSSLLVSRFYTSFETFLVVGNSIGAATLAVILLGVLTRHTTTPAALAALALGTALAIGLPCANKPGYLAIADTWHTILCFGVTFAGGYLLSFLVGRRKSNRDLRGLVLGCGTLGVRVIDEIIPIISPPDS